MQDNVVKQYISDYSDFDIETVYISKESEIRKIEKNEAKFQFNIIDSNLFKSNLLNSFFTVLVKDILSPTFSLNNKIYENLL